MSDILAPGYRLRTEAPTTVREAVWGGPRDDAEFVVEELLGGGGDEVAETTLDEFEDE